MFETTTQLMVIYRFTHDFSSLSIFEEHILNNSRGTKFKAAPMTLGHGGVSEKGFGTVACNLKNGWKITKTSI